MSDPQAFLKIQRQEIPFRPAEVRRQDWEDIQPPLPANFLKEQSTRCMDCGVPFCQGPTGCPVQNKIPEWNALVSRGQWKKAYHKLAATNNFPEWTGRLCPAPCESACVLDLQGAPVNIKSIEQSIIEKAFEEGWVLPEKAKDSTGRRVAVIGSGPAGLAAAQQLARKGHEVVVFEKEKQVGGLLRYGIPDFKMPKKMIDRRLDQLRQEGIAFQTSSCFGVDFTYEDLFEKFDAIALALGAEKARDLPIPGRDLGGVYEAMAYLTAQNRVISGELPVSPVSAHGKKVIILGGGDTGSDCLGTAIRQGASKVLQFEILPKPPMKRAAQTPWPMWPMKLKSSHAHEEGGERSWSLSTTELRGHNNQVQALAARPVTWKDGRPEEVTGSELVFEADLVILALGFTGSRQEYLKSIPNLRFSAQGQILTDKVFQTHSPGVFACGDARRGASLIVWAIAEGRQMADSIHLHLMNKF